VCGSSQAMSSQSMGSHSPTCACRAVPHLECPYHTVISASVADEVTTRGPSRALQQLSLSCATVKLEAHLEAAGSCALSQLHAQHPHKGALVRAQQVVRHRNVPLQRVDLRQMTPDVGRDQAS